MPKRKMAGKPVVRNSTIDVMLADIASRVLSSEAKAVIPKAYTDITENDMHIIEAVGAGEPRKSSEIARRLGVTAGTLTTNLNNLEKKNYITRKRSSLDKRVVYVVLTEKGRKAFFHQRNVHKKMFRAAISDFSEREVEVLHSCLEKLDHFFSAL